MTYAVISCRKCNRQRIIDKSSESSKCPYCGINDVHRGLVIIFENEDQRVVRDALMHLHPMDLSEDNPRKVNLDPLSTLTYKYENCSDPQEKMELLSKGLTEIHGTFTLEDIESIAGKNAERMLRTMLENCMVYEVRYGRYRS